MTVEATDEIAVMILPKCGLVMLSTGIFVDGHPIRLNLVYMVGSTV